MDTQTKFCKRCAQDKSIGEFGKDKHTKSGIRFYCKLCDGTNGKRYYKLNKESIDKRHKKYSLENRDKLNKHYFNKIHTNVNFRISERLRDRLRKAIKKDYKAGSAVSDLGCSIEEFKKYLESKFQVGMAWDNWGLHGWNIDHIVPLSKFDLTDRVQFLKCAHYTNLQPLWAAQNRAKAAKVG